MNKSLELTEAFSSVLGMGVPKAWLPMKKWNRLGDLV
jgi:hypothetical protein